MRVESVELKACHSVDFLRVEVSIGSKSERAWAAGDLPNVIVAVLHSCTTAVLTGPSPDVSFPVASTDDGIHETVHEHVVDDR